MALLSHERTRFPRTSLPSRVVQEYSHVLHQDLPWLDEVVRAKRPKRLPVVLTRDEVRAIVAELLHARPEPGPKGRGESRRSRPRPVIHRRQPEGKGLRR